MKAFLWGASAVAAGTAALFFLRFWRETRDRFFALFAAAFGALAVNWTGLMIIKPPDEARTYLYLVRLLAFCLIIAAIVDKNRGKPEGER
jgi:hypothetical protein